MLQNYSNDKILQIFVKEYYGEKIFNHWEAKSIRKRRLLWYIFFQKVYIIIGTNKALTIGKCLRSDLETKDVKSLFRDGKRTLPVSQALRTLTEVIFQLLACISRIVKGRKLNYAL